MDRRVLPVSSGVERKASSQHHLVARIPDQLDTRSRRRTSRRRVTTINEYHRDTDTPEHPDHDETRPPAPTITLVRAGRDTAVTPMLPPFRLTTTLDVPLRDESSWPSSPQDYRHQWSVQLSDDSPARLHHTPYLSPVPLTPRHPQLPQADCAQSLATTHASTPASRISPLPTPNFASRAGAAVHAYFPRLASFVSSDAATAVAPPPQSRNKSSCQSRPWPLSHRIEARRV